MDEIKVFTGNAHPALAQAVAGYLNIPLGRCEVFEFSNENIFVRILENVRKRDVFVIQPLSSPVNKSLVELLIMIDALKRASAEHITAVVPYYGYGRTDKKDQPRVPITARLVADLLTVAGANRLLTVDLHAPQIQGFFSIPVDELTALYLLGRYFEEKGLNGHDLVVVATDIGISCCTHPVFSGSAIERIASCSVKEVVVTDTIPVGDEKKLAKITVLPIAPLLGEAIHRIHTGLSIGEMFEQ